MIRYLTFCYLFLTAFALNASERSGEAAELESASSSIRWHAARTIATGNAQVGPWRMNDTELHYVDDPTVALRDDGELAIAWVDNQQQELLFQAYDAETEPQTETPRKVSRSPNIFSWLPRVLYAEDDQVYLLWQEIVFSGGSHGGEIFFSRSEDGGKNFTEALNLSNTSAGAGKGRLSEEHWDNGSLDFVRGSAGEIFAAWTEYEGALRFRRSLDGGRSFGEIIQVNAGDHEPARAPSLAVAPDGRLYLAWAVGESEAADIHIAISNDGGRSFDAPRRTHQSDGHSDTPALTIDTEGRIHLVYAERPAGSDYFHLRYVRLNQSGGAAAESRALSAYPADNQGARAPSISVDGDGRVYVIWEHHPDPSRFARGLGFAFSQDAGQTFTKPEMIPGSRGSADAVSGSLQGQLSRKLSVNARGEIAVVNSHFRLGEQSRVVLIRGELKGSE